MHPNLINTRNDEARQRIRSAAATLAEAHQIAPLGAVEPVERRQPAIAQMRELEHVADLLERLVTATAPQEAPRGNKKN